MFRAALLGVPLPICSCGVVPLAASLRRDGAGRGATLSFMVTTPTTGVDSVLATYSLMGGLLTAARAVGALVIGVAAGLFANLLGDDGGKVAPAARGAESETTDARRRGGHGGRIRAAAAYAYGELLGELALPLLAGILLGGAISAFVPDGMLERYAAGGAFAYLFMLLLGIPLYVCASGSIPLAAALMFKGVSPGAAMVFLIAGPATNMATMAVVSNTLGKRTLPVYLGTLIAGALAAGAAVDGLLAVFPGLTPAAIAGTGGGGVQPGALEVAAGALLAAGMLAHLVSRAGRRFFSRARFAAERRERGCPNCAPAAGRDD